jgi:hypothetical protein
MTRKQMLQTAASLLCAVFAAVAAEEPGPTQPKGITEGPYNGYREAVTISAIQSESRLVILPAAGGRILRYELMGESVFHEETPPQNAEEFAARKVSWPGGYQLDIGIHNAATPEHARLWEGPYQIKAKRDYTVVLASEPDPLTGIQLEKEVTLDPDTGEAGLVQRLKNISSKPITFHLRSRIFCKGNGIVMLPLNPHSRMAQGWGMEKVVDKNRIFDTYKPKSPQVTLADSILFADTTQNPAAIGTDSNRKWMAYAEGRVCFVFYSPYDIKTTALGDKVSIRARWDGQITELETLSPETTIEPGKELVFPSKWALLDLKEPATSVKQARKITGRIKPASF